MHVKTPQLALLPQSLGVLCIQSGRKFASKGSECGRDGYERWATRAQSIALRSAPARNSESWRVPGSLVEPLLMLRTTQQGH